MLKRQNVSKKLNNVTMYNMEEYGATLGQAIVDAGMNTPCPGFSAPEECPTILKPAVVVCSLIAWGIHELKN